MIESHKAKKFIIQELVPEVVFNDRGDKAWQLMDIRLLANLDALREQVGVPMTTVVALAISAPLAQLWIKL